jgi:hypothetical protein
MAGTINLTGSQLSSHLRELYICFKRNKFSAVGHKARPHTENIRGSNLAAVMCTTVQVSKNAVIPTKLGHNLCKAWTERGLYILYILYSIINVYNTT